jgi:hypothetical protein
MTKGQALLFGPFMFVAGLFCAFVGWRKLDPRGWRWNWIVAGVVFTVFGAGTFIAYGLLGR